MAVRNKLGKSFSYVNIQGFEEIKKVLDKLPLIISKNILRVAARAGAEVLSEAAKQKLMSNGSIISGRLYRSMGVVDKSSEARNVGTVSMKITAQRSGGFAGNHAHLVEYGHKLVIIHPISKKPVQTKKKRVKAYPFMRPAFHANAQKSIDVATLRLKQLVPPVLKKLLPGAKIG